MDRLSVIDRRLSVLRIPTVIHRYLILHRLSLNGLTKRTDRLLYGLVIEERRVLGDSADVIDRAGILLEHHIHRDQAAVCISF